MSHEEQLDREHAEFQEFHEAIDQQRKESRQYEEMRRRLVSLEMDIRLEPMITPNGLFFRITVDGTAADTVRASEVEQKLAMLAKCCSDCAQMFSNDYLGGQR